MSNCPLTKDMALGELTRAIDSLIALKKTAKFHGEPILANLLSLNINRLQRTKLYLRRND